MFQKIILIGATGLSFLIAHETVLAQGLSKIDKLELVDKTPTVELEYFVAEDFKGFGKISASWRQAEFLSNDDVVYLSMERPVSPGDRFSIYRKHPQVDDPMNRFSGGNRIQVVGSVRINEVKDGVIVAKIFNARDDVNRGDLIGEFMETSFKIQPKEPAQMVRGSIISPAGPTNLTGTYEFSFINKGAQDGLQVNDMLHIFRRGTGGRGIPTAALPEVNVASVVVVHVSDKFATVYNLTGIEQFEKGSTFKSAMNEVRYLDEKPVVSSNSN